MDEICQTDDEIQEVDVLHADEEAVGPVSAIEISSGFFSINEIIDIQGVCTF